MSASHRPVECVSRLPRGDQSFDDRALHLQKNIYGSDKGKLRLLILQRDLSSIITEQSPLSVLDAGCGMGLMSEWAASYGHHVTACDTSAVMVEQTQQRLAAYPTSSILQRGILDLPETQMYDVVFCHAVLEWVEKQPELLHKLTALLAPGGCLSLMFYNAWAREMAQLVYGNFDYVDKEYQVRQRVKLSPHYPAIPDIVEKGLLDSGLTIKSRSGIRVFYDIIRNKNHYQTLSDDIIRHELRISHQYPYWQMGRYVHFVAEKSN